MAVPAFALVDRFGGDIGSHAECGLSAREIDPSTHKDIDPSKCKDIFESRSQDLR